jgi:heterodisulfide reductase subunit C
MDKHDSSETAPARGAEANSLSAVWEKVRACMQCGTCTGSCGSSNAMDYTPRQMWRMVQLGMKEELFNSRTFWLCSSCYYCTLRCPRGLPLTEAIAALKRIAISEGRYKDKKSPFLYGTFMNTVRRYGRVREMELMTRYFLRLRDPLTPFAFAPLGAKLMAKGKIAPQMPTFFGKGKLHALFQKVRELEESP